MHLPSSNCSFATSAINVYNVSRMCDKAVKIPLYLTRGSWTLKAKAGSALHPTASRCVSALGKRLLLR